MIILLEQIRRTKSHLQISGENVADMDVIHLKAEGMIRCQGAELQGYKE